MRSWQSMRSARPPCPGIESPKSLRFTPRLKPEAKKPPKGAMSDAKRAIGSVWICTGIRVTKVRELPNYGWSWAKRKHLLKETLNKSYSTKDGLDEVWELIVRRSKDVATRASDTPWEEILCFCLKTIRNGEIIGFNVIQSWGRSSNHNERGTMKTINVKSKWECVQANNNNNLLAPACQRTMLQPFLQRILPRSKKRKIKIS